MVTLADETNQRSWWFYELWWVGWAAEQSWAVGLLFRRLVLLMPHLLNTLRGGDGVRVRQALLMAGEGYLINRGQVGFDRWWG